MDKHNQKNSIELIGSNISQLRLAEHETEWNSLLGRLDKEFNGLGFDSFINTSTNIKESFNNSTNLLDQTSFGINSILLFKNMLSLVERFKINLKALETEREKSYRLTKENEFQMRREHNLKETSATANKDQLILEEKLKQSDVKIHQLTKQLKETNEENRKLHSLIEQRDKQFKHDKKKMEQEMNRLKERIKNPVSAASFREISNTLAPGHQRSRSSTTNDENEVSVLKKQVDLYIKLVRDYEYKTRELISELNEVKLFVNHCFLNLNVLSKSLKESKLNSENEIIDENDNLESVLAKQDDDNKSSSHHDLHSAHNEQEFSKEIINQPFENVYFRLNSFFQSQFNLIHLSLFAKH